MVSQEDLDGIVESDVKQLKSENTNYIIEKHGLIKQVILRDAEIEQLKKENEQLKSNLEYWRCTPCEAIQDANKVLNSEITQLKSKLKVTVEALVFYKGEDKSDIELDIFDHFKCDHKGNSEFDCDWLCKKAREALKEIGEI